MSIETGRASPAERFFNTLGWLGFLFILPIGLQAFGVGGPLSWLEQNLGRYGRPAFLVLLFFGFLVLRILFGGDRPVGPLLLGCLMGFLLLCTAVEIGFMSWLPGLTDRIAFLSNHPLNFLVAIGVILLGILLSYLRRLPLLLQLLLLVVLPLGFLGFAHALPVFQLPGSGSGTTSTGGPSLSPAAPAAAALRPSPRPRAG